MQSAPSLGLAHIEPLPSALDEHPQGSRNDSASRSQQTGVATTTDIELGTLSARASLEANEALRSPQEDHPSWYWRPQSMDQGLQNISRTSIAQTPHASSRTTSYLEPRASEVLTRQSSRDLLPREQGKDAYAEEADVGLHALEPQLSARSRYLQQSASGSDTPAQPSLPDDDEPITPVAKSLQGKPNEFANLLSELTCVLVCSMGQLAFSIFIGDIRVNMLRLVPVLGIEASQTPWLDGAFLLANGLSVVVFGSLADLASPRLLLILAFCWLTVWNTVGAFSMTPTLKVLFFAVRAMQGLAVGVLVSTSMSILGRIYSPGVRKTRVFSAMAAAAPFGFWIGGLKGGALTNHLPWNFGVNAILCGLLAVLAWLTVPKLSPAKDTADSATPSLRNFDYLGALCASAGCACILFGLTQGSASHWTPYTYALVIVGVTLLIAFILIERRAPRPLIPNGLWKTSGFAPLAVAYFLGFGSYVGGWQFYAVQFWLRVQGAGPMTVALYLTPNAVAGVLATWVVSVTLHKFPGHWILTASMVAFALGPVFFLPQTPQTSYWILSLPGIFLVTFGPDMSFAAASVFITSSVPRSYQGAAGSVLVTVQNLSAAVVASLSDSVGVGVDSGDGGEIGLRGLRAIWWFSFGCAMVGAGVTAVGVRIPKTEEKEHVT